MVALSLLPIAANAADSWVLTPGTGSTATGTFTVTGFSIYYDDGDPLVSGDTINQRDYLNVELTFALTPTGFPKDSTTVIKLPDDLMFGTPMKAGSLNFPLNVVGTTTGEVFANAAVDITARTITLTYTDYPTGKVNIVGTLNFWVMASDTITDTAKEITFNNSFTGSGITIDFVRDADSSDEVVYKWGEVLLDTDSPKHGQYYVNFGMRLNVSGKLDIKTISDTLTLPTDEYPDAEIDKGSFTFHRATYTYDYGTLSWTYTIDDDDSAYGLEDLKSHIRDFDIQVIATPSEGTPFRFFGITFENPCTKAIIINYRIYLGTTAPGADDVFSNTVTITGTSDGVTSPQSAVADVKYLAGGSGSGVGNNYSIKINKLGENGGTLTGATFALYTAMADTNAPFGFIPGDTLLTTVADDIGGVEDGIIEFTGLLYEPYFIVETVAPNGYLLDPNPILINMNWLDGGKFVYQLQFTNDPAYSIEMTKVDENGAPLDGAAFTLYPVNTAGDAPDFNNELAVSNGTGGVHTFAGLARGKYFIVETIAPGGYALDPTPILADLNNTAYDNLFVCTLNDVSNEKLPTPPPAAPAPTQLTTPVNGVQVNYTIDNNGKVTLKPTDTQLAKLLDTIGEDGVLNGIVFDTSGMTSAILEIDLTKLLVSDKLQVFKFSVLGMELRFPVGALESMRKLATILRFGLKPGSVIFELTDANGKEINWYDFKNPVTISMPFTAPQDISTHQIVMTRGDGAIIPRSWYADGKACAKVCQPGTYDAAVKSLGNFTDTQGKWMNEAVGYMAARGIVEGVGDSLYDSYGTITRAQFVTMLMRSLDLELDYEEAMPPEDFASVPDWAQKSVRMATALGITLRDEDGNFNPNAPILRQEMFFMAYEAMDVCGMLPDVYTQQWVPFSDWEGNVRDEYAGEIQNLCKLKLVNGNGDGTLNPNGQSTRAEGAQFLCNILKYDAK